MEMKEQPNHRETPEAAVPVTSGQQPDRASAVSKRDPRLDDYLDHVYAPLVGVVPYARRQELRAELSAHLETLAASYEELGSTPEAAVVLALQQFGEPRRLSRQWIREWIRPAEPARVQPAWRAMLTALVCFGVASLFALFVLMADRNSLDPFVGMILVGALPPLLAGVVTGLLAPARHALGTFFALALLILPSIALGAFALNRIPESNHLAECGLVLAMIQSVYWMPIGCAAAALGGRLQSRHMLKPRRWVLQ
jgi:hypothetical protein